MELVHEGGAAVLPEIERRLDELDRLILDAAGRQVRAELQAQQAALLDLRDERRAEAPGGGARAGRRRRTFREDYEAAAMVAERRTVIDDGVASVTMTRGRPGRRTEARLLARLAVELRGEVGSVPTPDETWVA